MDSSRVMVTHQSARTQSYKSSPINFPQDFPSESSPFQVENTTALSYLIKMGGTGSIKMTALPKEIWKFPLSQKIIITVEYLPGKLSVRANWASRNFQDSSNCLLSLKAFQMISRNWGTCEKDLFVSFACHQLQIYMAWRPELTVRQQSLSNRTGKTWDFYMLFPLSH